MNRTNAWTRATANNEEKGNNVRLQYDTGESTRFELKKEDLDINQPPEKYGVTGEDDFKPSLPDLQCRDYRRLKWCETLDDLMPISLSSIEHSIREQSVSKDREQSLTREARKSKRFERNIEEIQAYSAKKLNMSSPIILETGGEAPRHAASIKGLLGSSCVVFNHPAYLRSAAEKLKIIHNIRHALEEEARKTAEEGRAYAELVVVAAQDTISRDLEMCKRVREKVKSWRCPVGIRDPNSRLESSFRRRVETNMKNTRSDRTEDDPRESFEMKTDEIETNSVLRAYSEAEELLQNHMSLLDNKRSVKASVIA